MRGGECLAKPTSNSSHWQGHTHPCRDTHSFYARGQGPTLGNRTPPTHTLASHPLSPTHNGTHTPHTPAGRNSPAHIPSLLAQNADPQRRPVPGLAAHSSQASLEFRGHRGAAIGHVCTHTRQGTYTHAHSHTNTHLHGCAHTPIPPPPLHPQSRTSSAAATP